MAEHSDYRMIAGILVFVVIFATIVAFMGEDVPGGTINLPATPELDPRNRFSFGVPPFECGAFIGLDCFPAAIIWFGALIMEIAQLFVDALLYMFDLVAYPILVLASIIGLRIPGLPPELSWIGDIIRIIFGVVIVLFIYRLIRSAFPMA